MELKKILVVDDSDLLHRMYDLVLMRYRTAGCVVLHARDGLEGLKITHTTPGLDLILLDVNMPKMSGIQMLEALRVAGTLARMKVVMVSSEGREKDVKLALELGASSYVTKPFKAQDLHGAIEKIFGLGNPLDAHRASAV